jgi:DNA-binding NtrC family response regulator
MATVLIVEDETVVLILAESVLQEAGHETLSAANVEQALALLEPESARKVDLLFTDIYLREQEHGGIQVAQEAVKAKPGLRVLYTSAQAITDGIRQLFVDGGEFLPKPYTAPGLKDAVERLLSKPQ